MANASKYWLKLTKQKGEDDRIKPSKQDDKNDPTPMETSGL